MPRFLKLPVRNRVFTETLSPPSPGRPVDRRQSTVITSSRMNIRARPAALIASLAVLAACQQDEGPGGLAAASRPNILLIVADDLGYQDLGLFGGEIRTPTIDGLAATGTVLTNFHASASCQPTRAMLLSGADHHIAGVGSQGRVIDGNPAYQNRLTERVASIAERMSELDYHTYMAGKWHLGDQPGQTPADRGFERSFVLLQPGAFHFDLISYGANAAVTYQDDGVEVDSLPEDFYSTIAYTDRMIGYIDEAAASDRPFFGYLAYTAPHWPIQALDEDMARVRGRYDEGYDVIRERRLQRLKELGYFPADAAEPRLAAALTPWSELTPERQAEERAVMEAYAAMVERLDTEIGRLLRHLDEIGELDDTLVVFMSDNGAEGTADGPFQAEYRAQFDNSLGNIGRRNSYRLIGLGWGEAGAAGDFLTKGSLAQGGIHVPAIVSAPALGLRAGRSDALLAALDLAPTFVELAGGANDTTVGGREVLPMTGRSLAVLLRGEVDAVRAPDEALAFANGPQRAVFRGDWKALWIAPPNGIGDWQLFDLARDPGETTDLAAAYPDVMAELAAAWERHAAEVGYTPPAPRQGADPAAAEGAVPAPAAAGARGRGGFGLGAGPVRDAVPRIPLYAETPGVVEGNDSEYDPTEPTLDIYIPYPERATGAGILILPGGGYQILTVPGEGPAPARFFRDHGVAAFVLRYRHAPRYHYPTTLLDAQRALRLIRSRAGEYGIDPDRVGVFGGSAGGHLAAMLATLHDENILPSAPYRPDAVDSLSARPAFALLLYPVIDLTDDAVTHRGSRTNLTRDDPELYAPLSPQLHVDAMTPPVFLVHGSNDRLVPVQNSLLFYQAALASGIPAEMHILDNGPHGFGMGDGMEDETVRAWPMQALRFMERHGMLSTGDGLVQ